MSARPRPARSSNPWDCLSEDQRAAMAAIALQVMHVSTLETRNSDRLDFPEVAVWNIREALARAFLAGRRRPPRQ